MDNIKKIILNYISKEMSSFDLLNMYYDIGAEIENKKINVLELEVYLKSIFGIVISFTRRNFKNMIKLYNTYKKEQLNVLENYKWIQIVEILNNKKITNYVKDESLIELNNLKNNINML